MSKESVSEPLKNAIEGKYLAKSFLDFIEIDWNDDDYYRVIKQPYYMWSEIQQKLLKRMVWEYTQWNELKEYVENGIVYLDNDADRSVLCPKL